MRAAELGLAGASMVAGLVACGLTAGCSRGMARTAALFGAGGLVLCDLVWVLRLI